MTSIETRSVFSNAFRVSSPEGCNRIGQRYHGVVATGLRLVGFSCLVFTQDHTRLLVDLSPLLQNPNRRIAAAIIAALFLAHALCSYGQEPPNDLTPRQIEALTTGDTSSILQVRQYSLQVQLTQRWTAIAARMFKEASADVHPDSALLLSKLIYRGALQFVRRDAPVQSVYLPEGNLRKFIETEIEIGKKDNSSRPPIGEKAFDQARHSICPLWPFC